MFKGWIGEKKTEYKLLFSLDSDVYTVYHNIIIPSRNGTTQIDHVIISPFGLFVVETKNLKGWIYGTETQSTWTQVVYQSKYKFQNPLRQSYRHKKVLSKHLRIKESYIYQVVSFVGDCQFKTEMPPNVIKSGLGSYIKQFNRIVFSEDEVDASVIEVDASVVEVSELTVSVGDSKICLANCKFSSLSPLQFENKKNKTKVLIVVFIYIEIKT